MRNSKAIIKRIVVVPLFFFVSLCQVGCVKSEEQIAEMNKNAIDSLATINVGDEMEFGSYNNNELTWNVILKTDGLYLLECQNNIDTKKWNDEGGSIDVDSPLFYANEWSNCSLRTWLNDDFYNQAFDKNAKAAIVKCDLRNSIEEAYTKSGGKDTQDNVFVLSYAECKKFVEPLDLLDCESAYWLRNPAGSNGEYAAICDGYLTDEVGDWYGGCSGVGEEQGVRPAIWVTNNGSKIASLNLEPATKEKDHSSDINIGGEEKCDNCNGTGRVKYYYGDSAFEAAINGHEDSWYGICGSCGGTGKKRK